MCASLPIRERGSTGVFSQAQLKLGPEPVPPTAFAGTCLGPRHNYDSVPEAASIMWVALRRVMVWNR